jgi:exonuclease III
MDTVGMSNGSTTLPGAAPSTLPPSSSVSPNVEAVLRQLIDVVQQLIAVLQAQQGAGALGGGAPGAMPGCSGMSMPGGPGQMPMQTPVQSPTQSPVQSPVQKDTGKGDKFRMASFNVLGASHTAKGGKHASWKSGPERVPGMIKTLKDHDVDVAGLQEFQGSQQQAFKRAKSGYALSGSGDNQIAYRSDTFRKVGEKSLTIPYFNGQKRTMPAVQLQNKQTGTTMWVVNIHNPADTARFHKQGRFRAEALRRERAFIEQLKQSGMPVFIVGDFNDNTNPKQTLTAGKLMTSAAGNKRSGIDQIFGSTGVSFSGWGSDRAPTRAQVSDHPIVTADVAIS